MQCKECGKDSMKYLGYQGLTGDDKGRQAGLQCFESDCLETKEIPLRYARKLVLRGKLAVSKDAMPPLA